MEHQADEYTATPTLARNGGTQLKAYPRISFQITLKGVVEMNYRIEKRAAFQVYGLEDVYDTVYLGGILNLK